MKIKNAVFAGLLMFGFGSTQASAAAWQVTDLGSADGVGAMALNDNGWAVFGNKVLSPNGAGGYTSTALSSTPGYSGFALYDINNSNTVVGFERGESVQGFVWSGGVRTNLPTLTDYYGRQRAEAKGINDSGQVVGNAGDNAAIWSPNGSGGYSSPTLLGYWEETKLYSGDGVSINNNGYGLMASVTHRPGYTNGNGPKSSVTILGGGLEHPVGMAINDRFAVAGYDGWYNCSGYSCDHPFIWTSGNNVTLLPLTPPNQDWPYHGKALALNEDNDVVGMGWYGAYDARAVLWSATPTGWQEIDLNTLLPGAGSNFYKLGIAMDINEKGQILGMGSVNGDGTVHAFLLTPAIPEPETYALFLAGLGLMGAIARRHRQK